MKKIGLFIALCLLYGAIIPFQKACANSGLPYMNVQDSIIKADYNRMSIYNDLYNDYYGLEGLCIRAFVGWCRAYADIDSVVVFEYEPTLKCIGRIEGTKEESDRHFQEQIDFFNRYGFRRQSHYDRLNVVDLLKSGACLAQAKVEMRFDRGLECKVKIIAAIPEKNDPLKYQNVYFLYTFKPRLEFFDEDNYKQRYKQNIDYDELFDDNGFLLDTSLTYQFVRVESWGPYYHQLDPENPPVSVKSIFPIRDGKFYNAWVED